VSLGTLVLRLDDITLLLDLVAVSTSAKCRCAAAVEHVARQLCDVIRMVAENSIECGYAAAFDDALDIRMKPMSSIGRLRRRRRSRRGSSL